MDSPHKSSTDMSQMSECLLGHTKGEQAMTDDIDSFDVYHHPWMVGLPLCQETRCLRHEKEN